jgi:hypothetical protein
MEGSGWVLMSNEQIGVNRYLPLRDHQLDMESSHDHACIQSGTMCPRVYGVVCVYVIADPMPT